MKYWIKTYHQSYRYNNCPCYYLLRGFPSLKRSYLKNTYKILHCVINVFSALNSTFISIYIMTKRYYRSYQNPVDSQHTNISYSYHVPSCKQIILLNYINYENILLYFYSFISLYTTKNIFQPINAYLTQIFCCWSAAKIKNTFKLIQISN